MLELVESNFMTNQEKITDTFLITKEFRTPTEFSYHIEQNAVRNGSSCMDVLIDYCIKNDIEADSINKLINNSLKSKLEAEAQDLNLLKNKTNKLPF